MTGCSALRIISSGFAGARPGKSETRLPLQVWQGGQQGFQRIYARFLSSSNTWNGNDLRVNTFNSNSQVNPVVATLAGGNVVVAWASFNQVATTSLQDIYAQVLSPTGSKINGEFLVNDQYTSFNQRSPALPDVPSAPQAGIPGVVNSAKATAGLVLADAGLAPPVREHA